MTTQLFDEAVAYERHKSELVDANEGKVVLIHGDEIAGIWDTYTDALAAGYKQFGLQPFLVRQTLGIERVQFFTRNLPLTHVDSGTTT